MRDARALGWASTPRRMTRVTKAKTGLATTSADTDSRSSSRMTCGGRPAGSGSAMSISLNSTAPRLKALTKSAMNITTYRKASRGRVETAGRGTGIGDSTSANPASARRTWSAGHPARTRMSSIRSRGSPRSRASLTKPTSSGLSAILVPPSAERRRCRLAPASGLPVTAGPAAAPRRPERSRAPRFATLVVRRFGHCRERQCSKHGPCQAAVALPSVRIAVRRVDERRGRTPARDGETGHAMSCHVQDTYTSRWCECRIDGNHAVPVANRAQNL